MRNRYLTEIVDRLRIWNAVLCGLCAGLAFCLAVEFWGPR